jgi:hypothetical protein
MSSLNNLLAEEAKLVFALPPAVPSSAAPTYVSLKNYERIAIIVLVKNATTVTGSAITLKQATSVAAAGEKALAFTTAKRNIDTGAADALADFTVSSNTFTTDATNSKNLMYVIEVKADDLDVNNGFDCVKVGVGDATAATVAVLYALRGAKYATNPLPSAIVD